MDCFLSDYLMKRFPNFETLEENCKGDISISNFYDRWKLVTLMTYYKIMENDENDLQITIFLSGLRSIASIQRSLEYLISNFSEYKIVQKNADTLRVHHDDTKKTRCVTFNRYNAHSLRGIDLCSLIILLDLDEQSYETWIVAMKNVLVPSIVAQIPIYKLDVGKDPTVNKPDPFDTKTMVKLSKF